MHKYVKHGKGQTKILDLAAWLTQDEWFDNAGHTFYGRTPEVLSPDAWGAFGQLPEDWKRTLRARWAHIGYVVLSYHTPIAWFDRECDKWIMPEHTYSATTTRHQSNVIYALSVAGIEVERA